MDARPRRSSSPAPAPAVSLLLLLLLSLSTLFWRQASACGDAPANCMTALQKHAAFFDGNKDGIISVSETYDAFRSLGFSVADSSFNAGFINSLLGPATRPENDTSRLSIFIENIHKGMHGSDSGAYDSQGRFVPEKLEEIFAKHAKTVPDALTSAEVEEVIAGNREPNDETGWTAAKAEWHMLYTIGKCKDGLLRKAAVRNVYDGSLFAWVAQERRSQQQQQH